MAKLAKSCIFCGGTGLSKEHIWPDWMRGYIPRANHSKVAWHGVGKHPDPQRFDKPEWSLGALARPGDTGSKRLRCVWKTCNNGWMSGLQTLNKPLLTSLLQGHWPANSFSAADLERLSAWITMFTMVVEFADPDTSVISEADRQNSGKHNFLTTVGVFTLAAGLRS
jgi:hypothetical protein